MPGSMWYAAWFATMTWWLPTPDYWHLWRVEALRSSVLPQTPGW